MRDVYRERPLVRVIFDRRLRTPPSARVFSTRLLRAPSSSSATNGAGDAAVRELETAGARVESIEGRLESGFRRLAAIGVQSVLLEGGASDPAGGVGSGYDR